jgi:RNA polymerase sigma-70 factor, ECF subfamily
MRTNLKLVAAGSDQATDSELLARAISRDENAFSELVDRHFQVVHRVVWRMMNGHADAEDVTQEAFLRLWRNPAQVREGGAVKGWLMRVASNLVMDRHRTALPIGMSADDMSEVLPDQRALADTRIDQSRATATIDQAIATLPDRQKLALTLVHFEHLPNATAANIMEISVDALESLLSRARRSLKLHLAPHKNTLFATLATERN